MDGFELNKIAATILIAGIVAMIAGNLADILYQPNKTFKRGYQVEVADISPSTYAKATEDESFDIPTLMAKADVESGKKDIKKCSICHTFSKGEPNRIGPNLWEIVDSAKASKKDFTYSKALLSKGGLWSYEDLIRFIYKPRKFASGTKMAFAGYKNPQDAANIVAFLRTLSDSPKPLPK